MKYVISNQKNIGLLKEFRYKKSKFNAKFLHYKNKPYKLNTKEDVEKITTALDGDQFEITNVNKKEKHVIQLTHLLLQPFNKKLHVS